MLLRVETRARIISTVVNTCSLTFAMNGESLEANDVMVGLSTFLDGKENHTGVVEIKRTQKISGTNLLVTLTSLKFEICNRFLLTTLGRSFIRINLVYVLCTQPHKKAVNFILL